MQACRARRVGHDSVHELACPLRTVLLVSIELQYIGDSCQVVQAAMQREERAAHELQELTLHPEISGMAQRLKVSPHRNCGGS